MLSGEPAAKRVKHYRGLPATLTGGVDTREEMRYPAFLVMETDQDGAYLYRYDVHGGCVGDTWHMSIEDAMHQVNYEFKGVVLDWQEVPEEVEDAAAWGLDRLRRK